MQCWEKPRWTSSKFCFLLFLEFHEVIRFVMGLFNYNWLVFFNFIIIILCCEHGFPWLSLTTHPYWPSLLAGSLDSSQCPHRADWCKSLLISLYWCVHVLEFKGECYLEFVLTSQVVLSMTCLSYLDGLSDGR